MSAEKKEEEVKVLNLWASPFGHRVLLALHEKDVAYEYCEEDLSNKSELLLKSNPVFKKIPVLIHNHDRYIPESNIIVEYIDEEWPATASLMPRSPYDRAQARFWADFIVKKVYLTGIFYIWSKEGDEHEEGKKNIMEYVATLEQVLGDKPYFNGNEFGFLDIAFLPFTQWFKACETVGNFSMDVDHNYPNISEWMKRCHQRDSVKKVLPDRHKIADFVVALRNKHLGRSQ